MIITHSERWATPFIEFTVQLLRNALDYIAKNYIIYPYKHSLHTLRLDFQQQRMNTLGDLLYGLIAYICANKCNISLRVKSSANSTELDINGKHVYFTV